MLSSPISKIINLPDSKSISLTTQQRESIIENLTVLNNYINLYFIRAGGVFKCNFSKFPEEIDLRFESFDRNKISDEQKQAFVKQHNDLMPDNLIKDFDIERSDDSLKTRIDDIEQLYQVFLKHLCVQPALHTPEPDSSISEQISTLFLNFFDEIKQLALTAGQRLEKYQGERQLFQLNSTGGWFLATLGLRWDSRYLETLFLQFEQFVRNDSTEQKYYKLISDFNNSHINVTKGVESMLHNVESREQAQMATHDAVQPEIEQAFNDDTNSSTNGEENSNDRTIPTPGITISSDDPAAINTNLSAKIEVTREFFASPTSALPSSPATSPATLAGVSPSPTSSTYPNPPPNSPDTRELPVAPFTEKPSPTDSNETTLAGIIDMLRLLSPEPAQMADLIAFAGSPNSRLANPEDLPHPPIDTSTSPVLPCVPLNSPNTRYASIAQDSGSNSSNTDSVPEEENNMVAKFKEKLLPYSSINWLTNQPRYVLIPATTALTIGLAVTVDALFNRGKTITSVTDNIVSLVKSPVAVLRSLSSGASKGAIEGVTELAQTAVKKTPAD